MCNNEKLLEEFHKMKNVKDGRRAQCKLCRKEVTKKYRKEKSVELSKKQSIYYSKNKEKVCKYIDDWVENNKEKVKQYKKKFSSKKENKTKKADYNKKYRANNVEKFRELDRKHRITNTHKIAWRRVLIGSLKRFGKKKEGHTIDALEYSALDFKKHMELLFTKGMSWENHGEWHIDHIKPVSKFDKNTPMNVVNALSNLQPLWSTSREIDGIFYMGNLNKWNFNQ